MQQFIRGVIGDPRETRDLILFFGHMHAFFIHFFYRAAGRTYINQLELTDLNDLADSLSPALSGAGTRLEWIDSHLY